MPGTYNGASTTIDPNSIKPVVVTSFDANSRAILRQRHRKRRS